MEKIRLGDACEILNGFAFKSENYVDSGIRVIRIANVQKGYIEDNTPAFYPLDSVELDKYMLEEGDLLISLTGNVGRVAILEKEFLPAALNQRVACLRLKTSRLTKGYLFHILNGNLFEQQCIQSSKGVAQKNMSTAWLKNYEIPLYSKEKQDVITEILDKTCNVISCRQQEIQKLDDLIKARFVEMFGGNDKKVAISSLCDVLGGYSFKSEDISSKGFIKILQIGNVYLDDVNWETTNYLPKEFDNMYSRFLLNEGDIVIALTRPIIQSLGNVKACIVKASDTPCLLNQRVGRIVSKKNVDVNLKFIYGCLMTDDFTRYVESCCIGCSQPNISTKDIENYMIPDASYEKQMDFVRLKEQVDKSKFLSNHSQLLLKSITF